MPREGRAQSVVVIGAGGHAKVVIGMLRAAGYGIRGVWDDSPERIGTSILGERVAGRVEESLQFVGDPAVIAIGSNLVRQQLAKSLPFEWLSVVHPAAWVDPTVRVGGGTMICAGAIIQPDAAIGVHAIVNTSASVDHENVIGDYAQIAPGASLGGNVTVGEGAFIGIGASVIQGRTIGAWSTIGAGAVVTQDIVGGVVAVGVPAKVR